jgi:hypothetical protein
VFKKQFLDLRKSDCCGRASTAPPLLPPKQKEKNKKKKDKGE